MKTKFNLHTFILSILICCAFVQCDNGNKSNECDQENQYAGIEISATSIKKTLLEKDENGDLVAISKTNPKQLNFSDDAEIDGGELSLIIDELKNQFETIARRCISKERIYIAFSSGLDNVKGVDVLKKEIITQLEFPEENMETINYHVETISAMKTSQHNLTEEELLFIDVGGSNTKIGVYDKSNNLYITEKINFGTRSLEEAIRKEVGSIPTFEQIEEIGMRLLEPEITNKLSSNAALNGKSSILFVGGASYCLAKNMYQEKDNTKMVTLNFSEEEESDLNIYKNAIIDDAVIIPGHLKYNHQELYTGYLILRELWKAADINVVYFMEQPSWIPGFVQYKITK